MTTSALVEKLKEADQDHEFYPTTNEIIAKVVKDLQKDDFRYSGGRSVLDVGAGNGKVLKAFKEAGFGSFYAIEKSPILCRQLPEYVMIAGTAFEEQSLLSKKVDIIFSNPPYSVFESWAEKIIREASCLTVYLVVPERWSRVHGIQKAIEYREATVEVLGNFDFEDSEDRAARAKVQLVKLTFVEGGDDAFERFFEETFKDFIDKYRVVAKEEAPTESKAKPQEALVAGPNYVERTVEMYNQEMQKIRNNYELLGQLDVDLLREFDVSPQRVRGCLKQRLEGLRTVYWNRLFSHLSAVTDRLTSSSRKSLLATLQRHVAVDFTVANVLEVLVWVLKNANKYMDDQLVQVFDKFIEETNVRLYKSNHRAWVKGWRYEGEEKNTHFMLDYRIVTHRSGGIEKKPWCDRDRGLAESSCDFIGDLLTVGSNLGFVPVEEDRHQILGEARHQWRSGEKHVFHCMWEGKKQVLFEVRGFFNSNLHFRMNKDFILSLNVEYGRLKKWLGSAAEAVEELQDTKAAKYFGANRQITAPNPTKLLSA